SATSPTPSNRRSAPRGTSEEPSSRKQCFELLLVEDRQLEFLCFFELRAGARPRDDVIRLRAHAPRGLAAQLAHERLGVGTADRLQRPREHERLAAERTVTDRLDSLRLDAR